MTVAELIKKLSVMPQDMQVTIWHDQSGYTDDIAKVFVWLGMTRGHSNLAKVVVLGLYGNRLTVR